MRALREKRGRHGAEVKSLLRVRLDCKNGGGGGEGGGDEARQDCRRRMKRRASAAAPYGPGGRAQEIDHAERRIVSSSRLPAVVRCFQVYEWLTTRRPYLAERCRWRVRSLPPQPASSPVEVVHTLSRRKMVCTPSIVA